MTTVNDLIETARRHLYGMQQGQFNFLTSTINDSATTLTVDLNTGGIQAGVLIGIDDEIIFVKAVSGQVATVSRGWDGSTAASHTAGAIIEVQPRFPRFAVKQALLDEINSWPKSLYQSPVPIEMAGSTTTRAYNLTSLGDFYDVLDVWRDPYTGSTAPVPVLGWKVERKAETSDYASGKALILPVALSEAVNLRITVSKPFTTTTFTSGTDVNTTIGLATSMNDIPPYGAAWRLLAPLEIKRSFTNAQPEPRMAEEVPAGSALRTAAGMKALRDERINEESDRLAASRTLRW